MKSKIKTGLWCKKLKVYFGKRSNELKNSLDVNNNTLRNFKNEIKSDFQKLENKMDNKIGTRKIAHWKISTRKIAPDSNRNPNPNPGGNLLGSNLPGDNLPVTNKIKVLESGKKLL